MTSARRSGLAFMPLYIDDYEAATAHLTMVEDGAYMRLLRLCWRTPGCKLPDDQTWIARKVRAVSDPERAAVAAVLDEFFTRGRGRIWSKRLLSEFLQKSSEHEGKSRGGKAAQAAKALRTNKTTRKIPASTKAGKQGYARAFPEPEPDPDKKEGTASAAPSFRDASPTFRESLLQAFGADPASGLLGPYGRRIGTQADMAMASRWTAPPPDGLGLTEAEVVAEVGQMVEAARARGQEPPRAFRYFDGPMADLAAAKAQPPPEIPAAPPRHSSHGDSDHAARQSRIIAAAIHGTTRPAGAEGSGDPEPVLARRARQ